MKKTTSIFALLCTLLNTSLIHTGPGNEVGKKKILNASCSNSSYYSESVTHGITEVEIIAHCNNNSTIAVNIPLSVKKIILTGGLSNNSSIDLYMRHNPTINANGISCSNGSIVRSMHPIRQYTFHISAASILLAAGMYYLYSQVD